MFPAATVKSKEFDQYVPPFQPYRAASLHPVQQSLFSLQSTGQQSHTELYQIDPGALVSLNPPIYTKGQCLDQPPVSAHIDWHR